MESADEAKRPYVFPRYQAAGDPAWYHVLHGTVPGHQIDFMYCPDVPQGRLTQTHFAHLGRLIKYIEPRQNAPYAFVLGNLSRDDVQHEAGHGGVALVFALRVAGVTDHAGRAMPPYAHGVLAIDRALNYATLLEAISVFYRRFLETGTEAEDATGSFYRSYFQVMQDKPEAVDRFLRDYVADFNELPQAGRSQLEWEWEADEATLPKRVTIVHADDETFSSVAHTAALLGAMLYKSNIKWTAITNGRNIEIPGGISIRFVPASEAPRDDKGLVIALDDVPEDEAELAQKVFGAKPREVEIKVTRAGWREALGAGKAAEAPAVGPARGAMGSAPGASTPPPNRSRARSEPPDADVELEDFDEAATVPAPMEMAPASERGAHGAAGAAGVAGGKAAPALVSVRVKSSRPPAADPAPASVSTASRGSGSKSRLGMWIGIAGGVGVIIAIIAAIAGSGGSGEGESGATPPGSLAPSGSAAPASGTMGAPSTPVSAASTVGAAPSGAATATATVAAPPATEAPIASASASADSSSTRGTAPKPTATSQQTQTGARGRLKLLR